MVNIKEFNNIKEYLLANPEGGYETWEAQWNPRKGKREKKELVATEYDEDWNLFWQTFPRHAEFQYKGHKFGSTRVMKKDEQVCKGLYIKIRQEDGVNARVVQRALEVCLAVTKEESYNNWKKENKLQYMSGCEPWLRQKQYVAWLDRELPTEVKTAVKVDILDI